MTGNWWRRAAAGAVVALVAGTGCGDRAAGGEPEPEPLGPGEVTVTIDIEHSRFLPDRLRVVEGTEVRFVVDNGDPIGHELIVGPPSVHERHAAGTHGRHPPVTGEVSVDPNAEAATTYRFDRPGTVEFACHLPGHYDHGMRGEVEVVAAERPSVVSSEVWRSSSPLSSAPAMMT